MSKLTLITTNKTDANSYLCACVDANSLVETWIRLVTLAQNTPKTLYLFQMDDAEISSDTNLFDDKNIMTHCYVAKIPDDAITIDVKALLYSTEIYDYALGKTPEEKEAICKMFMEVQDACIKKVEFIEKQYSKINEDEVLYNMLLVSGIISFLWQVATGNSVTTTLYTIQPDDFVSFPLNEIENHDYFTNTLNFAAKNALIREAKRNKIGRNDLCSCGSGKKFKYCHAIKCMDELIVVH